MDTTRRISDTLQWIGVNDHHIERFENMIPVPTGIAYHAYLITGGKTCLMDAVDVAFSERFFDNLRTALNGRPLDYIVMQHMEPDHAGSYASLLRLWPEARLVCSQKAFTLFKQFFEVENGERFQIVKEGDSLDLDGPRLRFIAAPMVHWPEVIMTYEETEGTFFSADAFGSFGCTEGHLYFDQIDFHEWAENYRRYYVNIVGRFGPQVLSVLKKAATLDIRRVCPLHGHIVRRAEDLALLLDKYQHWASYTAEEKGVVIAYASMYGHLEQFADKLAALLSDAGVKQIRLFDVSRSHWSYLNSAVFRFSHLIVCAPNHNTELYPLMDAFLRKLMSLNLAGRDYALAISKSWGGRAAAIAEELLQQGKNMRAVVPCFEILSSLHKEQDEEFRAWAAAIAQSVNED